MAVEISEVTNEVYCVRRVNYMSCCYFVNESDGVVLIDAGMDVKGQDMLDGLAMVGRSASDIKGILLTHWHNDHSAGASALSEMTGAPVFYHEAAQPYFTKEQEAVGLRGKIASYMPEVGLLGPMKSLFTGAPPKEIHASRFVEHNDTVLDDYLVLHTPGHEEGHVSFYNTRLDALFAGDALAIAHGKISFLSRFLTPDKDAAKQSMIDCIKLEPRILCPGHRNPMVIDDPSFYKEALQRVTQKKIWPVIGCEYF